ncbi:hypothetical protein NO1_0747 [Candidatus Termititenax aidoneus]|uniref:Uncharacterized protein n=1 Tax=Termititenax aidoneus TaxID=2218524 RepID=A0A388T9N7_TERA1|nr:hypothetical protein NO1_0747 [Candidatus Termititenax aidoneus]
MRRSPSAAGGIDGEREGTGKASAGKTRLIMSKAVGKDEVLFAIRKNGVQSAALEKLNRELTDEEIQIAKKGLQFGLLTDIDTVYKTIFTEMI